MSGADGPDPRATPFAGDAYFKHIAGSWIAVTGLWRAWLEAAQALSKERGVEAGKSLARLFDPEFWKAGELSPLFDDLRHVLSFPQLADLPDLDMSTIGASAAMVDFMGLVQQYMRISIPLWISASERFQAEIAARARRGEEVKSPGEALDLWNGVLDRTLMEFNRSGDFAKIQQRLLRASAQCRLELRKAGERGARLFDMPTRTEMTDVYHRMHEMQREVQKLRREMQQLRAGTRSRRSSSKSKRKPGRDAE
jgi:Poly(R)-hydroxyalkanoic acid synthase subunit (PHA_synth_III_E)